ncbi:hypothetical protein EVAR_20305_1 [Eumeta japonica]|uniref:Uncharacterized protein n=1 Tax=Eumeta variegata TaxID=151549 RepID=A0A4C1VP30_EUMVA|nr:hypothetical protein EVAR_20305_1 [Eumeta japonica]
MRPSKNAPETEHLCRQPKGFRLRQKRSANVKVPSARDRLVRTYCLRNDVESPMSSRNRSLTPVMTNYLIDKGAFCRRMHYVMPFQVCTLAIVKRVGLRMTVNDGGRFEIDVIVVIPVTPKCTMVYCTRAKMNMGGYGDITRDPGFARMGENSVELSKEN